MKDKQVIIIFFVCILASCKTETKNEFFTLDATLTNISDSTLFFLNDLANITLDSAYVVNGKLSLKGKIDSQGPERLTLFSASPEFIYTPLLIGNERVIFEADKSDFPWNIDMSGSVHQDQAERFNQVSYQRQRLIEKLKKSIDSDKELLAERKEIVSDSLDNEMADVLKENFNSYAALSIFQHYKTKFSAKELVDLYNQLDDELKETAIGKAIKLHSEFSKPEVGDEYYDYRAVNQNGDWLSLSDIESKYILLHFSSSACYGSQLSLPELKEIYSNYADDLEIISISTDIDRESWENHVKRDSISWNYLWDGGGDYNDAFVKYWGMGTPTYVLISPDGIIRERWIGFGDGIIKEKLGEHIKKL